MPCNKPIYLSKTKRGYKFDGQKTGIEWEWERKTYKGDMLKVPCGKCIGCRLDYSRDWANRCYLESLSSKNNYFMTLTYNNENIPKTTDINQVERPTLNKQDLVKFLKRLRITWQRKYNNKKIRFFACGEYGSKYARPHYHIIIFNIEIKELKYQTTIRNNNYYINKEIEKIWGKGFVSISRFTRETAEYTAKYMLKKVKGAEARKFYENLNIVPEYTTMSKQPGIGAEWFNKNTKRIWEQDSIPTLKKGKYKLQKLPKFYDNKLKKINPERFEKIKEIRIERGEARQIETNKHNYLNEIDQRKLKNYLLEKQLKRHRRILE